MAAVPDVDPSLPARIGKFEITAHIGWGAFARVMRGWDPDLAGPVAIKQLDARSASNRDIRERFAQEARLLYNADDPRVVKVIAASDDSEPQPWFVMRYVTGGTLYEHLNGRGTLLTPDEATSLGIALTSCLSAVHDLSQAVHRDVKPENVLLSPLSASLVTDPARGHFARHQLLFADLGLAKPLEYASRMTNVVGTDHYMAPQQAEGLLGADRRDDLYSVGVMVYEALTGAHPFVGDAALKPIARLGQFPVPVVIHRADAPADLAAAIEAMLAPERADRPNDAATAQARFAAVAQAARRPLPPPPLVVPTPFDPSFAGAGTAVTTGAPATLAAPPRRLGRRAVTLGLTGAAAAALAGWKLTAGGTGTSPTGAPVSSSSTTPATPPPTTSISATSTTASIGPPATVSLPADRNCRTSVIYVSTEKAAVLTDLLTVWNQRAGLADPANPCVQFEVRPRASGTVACWLANQADCDPEALAAITADQVASRPMEVWMPASSAFGALVEAQAPGTVELVSASTMSSPMVMAIARSSGEALRASGGAAPDSVASLIAGLDSGSYTDRLGRVLRLGRTDPFVSATGLASTVMIDRAARATDRADAARLRTLVESTVVHYGPSGPAFFTAALRHEGDAYVDVVMVEEKTVLDYNDGDPESRHFRTADGLLTNQRYGEPGTASAVASPTGEFRLPTLLFDAVVPTDGSVLSDHPMYVATSADADVRQAAAEFAEFLRTDPWARAKLAAYHLRIPADELTAELAQVDSAAIELPGAIEVDAIRTQWRAERKGFRVLFACDVSTSMTQCGEPRLDAAVAALGDAIGALGSQDRVAVVPFSSDAEGRVVFAAPGAPGDAPMVTAASFQRPDPTAGLSRQPDRAYPNTPLFEVAVQAVTEMAALDDGALINAVVLLTDGVDDRFGTLGPLSCNLGADGEPDDQAQLEAMAPSLAAAVGDLGVATADRSVRLFTVAFGSGSDPAYLAGLAEATGGSTWDAASPDALRQVLRSIVREF